MANRGAAVAAILLLAALGCASGKTALSVEVEGRTFNAYSAIAGFTRDGLGRHLTVSLTTQTLGCDDHFDIDDKGPLELTFMLWRASKDDVTPLPGSYLISVPQRRVAEPKLGDAGMGMLSVRDRATDSGGSFPVSGSVTLTKLDEHVGGLAEGTFDLLTVRGNVVRGSFVARICRRHEPHGLLCLLGC
jgi:hypothetical protein